MKKLLGIFIAAIMLIGIAAVMVYTFSKKPVKAATTIYVATNVKGGDGTINSPFGTIEEAVDAAGTGTIIYLREGRYEENIYIDKSDIEIKAYPDENVILTLPKGNGGAVIELDNCNNIKISDFVIGDIAAENVYGVLVNSNVHNVYISSNEFRNIITTNPDGNGEANAILCLGEGTSKESAISNIHIEKNYIHDNVNGWSENISIAGNCEKIYVTDNTVCDCTNIGIDFYGNAGYSKSPKLDHPRNCVASGNIVYNCVCSYAECAGIYVDGGENIKIIGNTVYKNDYGIEVGSEEKPASSEGIVKNIQVCDNRIYENAVCGIIIGGYTEDDKTGTVTETKISGNHLINNGIEISFEKCEGITVSDNYIEHAMKDALFIGTQMPGRYVQKIKLENNTFFGKVEEDKVYFELPYENGIKSITGIDKLNDMDYADGNTYVKGSISEQK